MRDNESKDGLFALRINYINCHIADIDGSGAFNKNK